MEELLRAAARKPVDDVAVVNSNLAYAVYKIACCS